MTYQFRDHPTDRVSGIDWMITCAAWRGSCLEIYSRAELSIDDCIATLENLSWDIGPQAHHPGAAGRVRALKAFLEHEPFSSHVPACLRMLENWADLMTKRALVAHGTMSVAEGSVTLRYSEHRRSKGVIPHESTFIRYEMLTLLARLTSDQRKLHQQLGQIKAGAAKAPPL